MKTAEDFLNERYYYRGEPETDFESLELIINEARKEAIEAAYELALLGNGKEILSLIKELK